MPLVLTERSRLRCGHVTGAVALDPSQSLVRIDGQRVLIEPDPEHRPIDGCPNVSTTTRACQHTLQVHRGYSSFVRVGGHPIVLADLEGVTDGSPPAGATYEVAAPNEDWVVASA